MNKKRIILTSLIGRFQYATRAQVAYVGALTHSTKLLKISIDNGGHWGNDYYQDDMASHISGNHLVPITTGEQAKDAALTNFYAQPEFGVGGDYTNWLPASANDYAQISDLTSANVIDNNGVNNTTTNFWTTDANGHAIVLGTVVSYSGGVVTFSNSYTFDTTNGFVQH